MIYFFLLQIFKRGYVNDKPLNQDLAIQLKMLVFGTANQTFPSGWLQQSFQFQNPFFHDPKKNDMHGCPFGLIQKKGGPCGILAVVQAYIIKVVPNIIRKQKPIVVYLGGLSQSVTSFLFFVFRIT